MVINTMAGIFILAIVCGVGFGVASAGPVDDVAKAGAFGYDAATTRTTSSAQGYSGASSQDMVTYEQSALTSTSARTIEPGMRMVDSMERSAKYRAQSEDEDAIDRADAQKAKQGEFTGSSAEAVEPGGFSKEERLEYTLEPVDWTVGRKAFVEEWTRRIDKFLAGSNLAGYGKVFAEAAWENGVDPRFSPAISNTESGRGSECFLPYNAWGWGSSTWNDWETAIRDHVAGLAEVYGYTVSYEAAGIYCPPNQDNWYHMTITAMASI